MDRARRAFLRHGSALGVALLVGCGGRTPTSEALSARLDGAGAGEDGELVVDVLVTNETGESREATLYVYATVKGTMTRGVQPIELAASETKRFQVAFEDVQYESFRRDGKVTFDLE